MLTLTEIKQSLLHLIFPHTCDGCGVSLGGHDGCLCLRCADALPETNFDHWPGNPVERKFYGRLPLEHAAAQYYFAKDSLLQHLVHQLKYKGNKELGLQLGRMMGDSLKRSGRFTPRSIAPGLNPEQLIDLLIPLPLFPARERKRGYNQSAVLCEGIAEVLHIPIGYNIIIRPEHTETQTRKGRIERWKNIEGKFILTNPGIIAGKHVLLVDDVITTGATLESCGAALLQAGDAKLSVACLCTASR
jgi:ComF family protein